MLIKINRDSFIESSSIEQYYLDGVKIIFYISSRKHDEIYDSEESAGNVFNRIASSFRDATTEPISKPTEQKLAEKQEMFLKFWELYNKKINRDDAIKKWMKLSMVDMNEALNVLPLYVKSTPDKQYRKNPSTWIYQKAWRNEIISSNEMKQVYQKPKFTNVDK